MVFTFDSYRCKFNLRSGGSGPRLRVHAIMSGKFLQFPVTEVFSKLFNGQVMRSALTNIQTRYYAKHFRQPSIGPLVHVGAVVMATGYYFHDKHFQHRKKRLYH